MSSTKRRPIAHTARTQFTPYAVEIYEEMGRLMCRCGPPRPGLTSPEEYCNACERWYDLHTELNRELQCRPWQWPCVGRQGPKHAGSMCMNAEIAERMRLLREGVSRCAPSVVPRRKWPSRPSRTRRGW
jgi:hypothetical protein